MKIHIRRTRARGEIQVEILYVPRLKMDVSDGGFRVG